MKDVETLLNAFDGEILANKARVKYNTKVEIVARLEGNTWAMTDKGRSIFAEYNSTKPKEPAKAEAPAPKKRATKARKATK